MGDYGLSGGCIRGRTSSSVRLEREGTCSVVDMSRVERVVTA